MLRTVLTHNTQLFVVKAIEAYIPYVWNRKMPYSWEQKVEQQSSGTGAQSFRHANSSNSGGLMYNSATITIMLCN